MIACRSILVRCMVGLLLAYAAAAQAPGSNPIADQVSALLKDGLDAKTPEEKLDIAKQVILLDPNNQTALELRKEAIQQIEANTKDAELKVRQSREESQKRADAQDSFAKAQNSLQSGKYADARRDFARAKSLGLGGPAMEKLDRILTGIEQQAQFTRYLAYGGTAALVAAVAVVVVFLRRKREPVIEVIEGKGRTRRYPIEKDAVLIGAVQGFGEDQNDIVMTDRLGMISRYHCEIRRQNGKIFLVDCRSANGTFLNDRRIPGGRLVPLKNGDQIDLARSGRLRIRYERKKKG